MPASVEEPETDLNSVSQWPFCGLRMAEAAAEDGASAAGLRKTQGRTERDITPVTLENQRLQALFHVLHSAEPSGRWCGGQRPLGGVTAGPN